jgi:NADPH2:quinone reductase
MVVKVAAAGVNFADMLVIRGSYQEKLTPPFVPGTELCGRVIAIGDGVPEYSLGDLVMAQVSSGAFAQYASVDPKRATLVPKGMSELEAAGFYIPYGTAYVGLVDRARLKRGDTVLVTGAGGAVGRAAIEVARATGAEVIAVARGAQRRAELKSAGAHLTIGDDNLRESVTEATSARGVDIVFDMVGGEVARQAMRTLRFEGRLVLTGFASGEIPSLPANHILVKNIDVCGFFWSPYQTFRPEETRTAFTVLKRMYREGLLHPRVAASYPLNRLADAFDQIGRRSHTGKLVIEIATDEMSQS